MSMRLTGRFALPNSAPPLNPAEPAAFFPDRLIIGDVHFMSNIHVNAAHREVHPPEFGSAVETRRKSGILFG
jgi:hypothetical protein